MNFSQEFIFLPKDSFSPWGWARTETVTQLYFTLFGLDSTVRTGWGLADNRQAFIGMDRLTGGFVVLQEEEPPGKHKLLIFSIVLFVWAELLVCTGCFLLLKVLPHFLKKLFIILLCRQDAAVEGCAVCCDYVVRTRSYPLGLWQICMETDSIIPCCDTANDLQIAALLTVTSKCPYELEMRFLGFSLWPTGVLQILFFWSCGSYFSNGIHNLSGLWFSLGSESWS